MAGRGGSAGRGRPERGVPGGDAAGSASALERSKPGGRGAAPHPRTAQQAAGRGAVRLLAGAPDFIEGLATPPAPARGGGARGGQAGTGGWGSGRGVVRGRGCRPEVPKCRAPERRAVGSGTGLGEQGAGRGSEGPRDPESPHPSPNAPADPLSAFLFTPPRCARRGGRGVRAPAIAPPQDAAEKRVPCYSRSLRLSTPELPGAALPSPQDEVDPTSGKRGARPLSPPQVLPPRPRPAPGGRGRPAWRLRLAPGAGCAWTSPGGTVPRGRCVCKPLPPLPGRWQSRFGREGRLFATLRSPLGWRPAASHPWSRPAGPAGTLQGHVEGLGGPTPSCRLGSPDSHPHPTPKGSAGQGPGVSVRSPEGFGAAGLKRTQLPDPLPAASPGVEVFSGRWPPA
nr:uncharacterized protein LOC106027073 [Cavia porcellus]